jgi:hypothetical protein
MKLIADRLALFAVRGRRRYTPIQHPPKQYLLASDWVADAMFILAEQFQRSPNSTTPASIRLCTLHQFSPFRCPQHLPVEQRFHALRPESAHPEFTIER